MDIVFTNNIAPIEIINSETEVPVPAQENQIRILVGPPEKAYEEIPGGVKNGVNTIFTLANTPIVQTLDLYLNGIRLSQGSDYTLLNNILTMINIPYAGDSFLANYEFLRG